MEEIHKSKESSTVERTDLGKKAGEVKDAIQSKAESVLGEGKAEVKAYAKEAQQKTVTALAVKKEQAVGELGNLAQALRQTGAQLRQKDQTAVAKYTDKAAQQIDRVSGYLSNRDMDQLIDEGEALARRNPELFIGLTFGLGLLAARFIKSSRQRRNSQQPSAA
ncbi:MAG: hypothetical protein NPIRA04_31960 [Nitrospirales bacterium]|nr:MAG: hypothetical protein NPIRA04_31960 [Nitrospirales bacterium]